MYCYLSGVCSETELEPRWFLAKFVIALWCFCQSFVTLWVDVLDNLDKFIYCYLLFFLPFHLGMKTLRANLQVARNQWVHKIINANINYLYLLLLIQNISVLDRKIKNLMFYPQSKPTYIDNRNTHFLLYNNQCLILQLSDLACRAWRTILLSCFLNTLDKCLCIVLMDSIEIHFLSSTKVSFAEFIRGMLFSGKYSTLHSTVWTRIVFNISTFVSMP